MRFKNSVTIFKMSVKELQHQAQIRFFLSRFNDLGHDRQINGSDQKVVGVIHIYVFTEQDAWLPGRPCRCWVRADSLPVPWFLHTGGMTRLEWRWSIVPSPLSIGQFFQPGPHAYPRNLRLSRLTQYSDDSRLSSFFSGC